MGEAKIFPSQREMKVLGSTERIMGWGEDTNFYGCLWPYHLPFSKDEVHVFQWPDMETVNGQREITLTTQVRLFRPLLSTNVVALTAEHVISIDILHDCTVNSREVQRAFSQSGRATWGVTVEPEHKRPTTILPAPSHAMFKKETERL